jgi:hypothetical protein
MSIPLLLGTLLFGLGSGALLTWLQQSAAKTRFRHELEAQVEQALFGRFRPKQRLNTSHASEAAPAAFSGGTDSAPPDC